MRVAYGTTLVALLLMTGGVSYGEDKAGGDRTEKAARRAQEAGIKRGERLYVQWSCSTANCHSFDPKNPAISTDLLDSAAMAADVNGEVLSPFVLEGTPAAALHQMPQYSRVVTKADIADMAAYIHHVRQERRYARLSSLAVDGRGDAGAGEGFFKGDGGCVSCHASNGLAAAAKRCDPATLRSRLLRPQRAAGEARDAHARLLEKYTDADVQNLVAYLGSLK
jgi:mono/diheme cytochrome c family protein